ncbi:MAG: nucleotidyltransferase family protein [Gemmatimonadetes bacterium]|nr:nucleotidyltransferase family protein [Gemmatimonadota bacterium]MYK65412.1 nucleotidyltransferase family protein [Gemmatimonadota bacterium]
MHRSGSVAGVVLAAGASRRMGVPKPLLDAGGMTFAERLVGTLAKGGCDPVVVVGAAATGPLAEEVSRGAGVLVVNPGGRGGQIGSLRAALDHLEAMIDPPGAFAFTPVDNPSVAPTTVRALVEAWRGSRAAIVVPRCGSVRGHPVVADMSIAAEFRVAGLPEGARTVVRRDPGRVLEVEVADPGVAEDLDTPERYLQRFSGTHGRARERRGRGEREPGRGGTPA